MFLSRVILFLTLCWAVECDLLDLYVQHMDETMKTIAYQKNHVKNLARGRNKRNAPLLDQVADEEASFYKYGNFKKQKLEVDEGWYEGTKEPKKIFIEKDDGLDFHNKQEQNLDSGHYEIVGNEKIVGFNIPIDTELEPKEKHKGKGKKVLLKKDDGLAAENAAEESDHAIEDFELLEQEQSETLESGQEFSPEFNAGQESTTNVLESAYEAIDMDDEEVPASAPVEGNSVSEVTPRDPEIEEDVNLDFEMVNQPEDTSGEKTSGWNPSLKRNPKAIGGRTPKKYAPTEKYLKFRQKVTNVTTKTGDLTSIRTKRSAKTPRFLRREELDDDGHVILEWDPTDDEIVVFRVTAKTLGYVGIGFNDKSHMKGADILLAWIDNHNGDVNLLVSIIELL